MSYILDALKKAEKERQRNTTKELLFGGDTSAQLPHKRIFWPYLLTIALLLNVGLFGWILGPWHAKGPKHAASQNLTALSSPTSDILIESPPAVSANSPLPPERESEGTRRKGGEAPEEPANIPSTTRADKPLADVRPGNEVPRKAAAHDAAPPAEREEFVAPRSVALQSPAVDHASPAQEDAVRDTIADGNKVYRMNELPQSVLSGLPDLSLSLHLYNADPSSRLINVKGRTLREGQVLSPGLKLEEIRPDGAVFSFRNYRFEVGINSR
jgi:general secretion pathway protein B